MPQIPKEIILVVPVWNDSRRLANFAPELVSAVRKSGLPILLVVADDCSSPKERARLAALVAHIKVAYSQVELFSVARRTRKGGAIYGAWNQFPNADWLAFVDADGAVSGRSVVDLIHAAIREGKQAGVIAVRQSSVSKASRRHFNRYLAFCFFRLLVRLLVGVRFSDTQCGAKVVSCPMYTAVAGQLQERGFIFDVELLLLLEKAGCRIVEVPTPWQEKSFGKISPYRDAWRMLAALWRIRRRLKSGHYSNGN